MTLTAETFTSTDFNQLAINRIRTFSIDAVQPAKSGHPGTPMALAPLEYTIRNRVVVFDPVDPIWPNCDRFVLSNGHASILLWSMLHLTRKQAVNAKHERLGNVAVTIDGVPRAAPLPTLRPPAGSDRRRLYKSGSTFGVPAPLKELQHKFRFEPERVTAVAKELLRKG